MRYRMFEQEGGWGPLNTQTSGIYPMDKGHRAVNTSRTQTLLKLPRDMMGRELWLQRSHKVKDLY